MQLHPAPATGLHWHDRKPASAWSPRQRDGTADAKSRPAQPSPPSGRSAPGTPVLFGAVWDVFGAPRRRAWPCTAQAPRSRKPAGPGPQHNL